MIELGAVCGRFQIFHNDHLQYVLAAKERCRRLIVGITSPDRSVAPVEVLWERNDKIISSSMIRRCIREGQDWNGYVPEATWRYLTREKIDQRIRDQK